MGPHPELAPFALIPFTIGFFGVHCSARRFPRVYFGAGGTCIVLSAGVFAAAFQFRQATESVLSGPGRRFAAPRCRMLTVLGGLAEFERELIKARTTEGRERAKRAGVKMGRKPLLSPHQIAEIRGRKAGGESVRFLARSYGVSPNTISRVR